MIHSEAQQLLAAGAALEDLAPDEWREYEAHRRTCAECARLEIELDQVLADLALALPERMPPPDLLDGIRRAIGGGGAMPGGPSLALSAARTETAPAVIPAALRVTTARPVARVAPVPEPVPFRRPDRRATLAAIGLAAVLGVVAVGLGARTATLTDQLGDSQARLAALQETIGHQGAAIAVAVHPAHHTSPLVAEPTVPGATAYVIWVPGTRDAWLVAHGLPPTPDGKAYQLWYADEAGVHGLSAFRYDGHGAFVAPFSVDLATSHAAMVTLEPVGGAVGEPGPQVVFGEL